MRLFPVTLMFLAWLLYGAMPAMAAFPASVETGITTGAQQMHRSHGMAAPDVVDAGDTTAKDTASDEPCPHRGSMKHVPFCAACLVLPPFIDVSSLERPLFHALNPGMIHIFVAGMPAPPERPPRS